MVHPHPHPHPHLRRHSTTSGIVFVPFLSLLFDTVIAFGWALQRLDVKLRERMILMIEDDRGRMDRDDR